MCHTTRECDNTWILAVSKECVIEVLWRVSDGSKKSASCCNAIVNLKLEIQIIIKHYK